MPEEHAKLSPSAADRWMVCPGSQVLCEGLEERTSPYAEEGTLAHSVAEKWLRHEPLPKGCTTEMKEHVQVYVDHVESIWEKGEVRMIEKVVHVNDHIWGTADAIVWIPETATLHVVDLKYGAGVAVEVNDNRQLKTYALAALLELKYPAKKVVATIVQPRLPHADGPIRSKEFDALDLMDFHADMLEASRKVDLAFTVRPLKEMTDLWADTYLVPSEKGCKWCLAAPTCPKLKKTNQEVAKQVFAVNTPYDPKELARTLDALPLIEAWIKNVREFAYAEAEKGNDIPDYKLVEKRASRKWRDEAAAAAYFKKKPEFFTTPELISPTQAEKLIDNSEKEAFEALVVKESSGHTLVHNSDKRPGVRIDAKTAFATLSEEDLFS